MCLWRGGFPAARDRSPGEGIRIRTSRTRDCTLKDVCGFNEAYSSVKALRGAAVLQSRYPGPFLIFLFAFACFVSPLALSQSAVPDANGNLVFRANARTIVVDVVVTDRKGKPIERLAPWSAASLRSGVYDSNSNLAGTLEIPLSSVVSERPASAATR